MNKTKNKYIEFSFKGGKSNEILHIPVILKIGGEEKEFQFLVDTGASSCFIAQELVPMLNNAIKVDDPDDVVCGSAGVKNGSLCYRTELFINGIPYIHNLKTISNVKALQKEFQNDWGFVHMGTIGSDFLKKYNAVFDFGNRVIRFDRPE